MQATIANSRKANDSSAQEPRVADLTGTESSENGNSNRALVEALLNSKTYRDYERAFSDLTGLPIALQPVETWQLPHHGKRGGTRPGVVP